MGKKLDILLKHIENKNFDKALSLAAKFTRLGKHKNAIILGHEARVHRDMYRQLGKKPDELIKDGIKALLDRYCR